MGNGIKSVPQTSKKVLLSSRTCVPTVSILDASGEELLERLQILRHDLRSSIGIIQNTLFLLKEESGEVSTRAERYIRVLQRQATHMEEILQQCRPPKHTRAATG